MLPTEFAKVWQEAGRSEADFARVCDRVREGMNKPGRVREGYGRGGAKVFQ